MPRTARSSKHIRPLVGLAAAGVVGVSVLGFAGTAQAASVNPNPINSGNPTCATLVPGTTQFKLDAAGLRDGTYSDGTLTVMIANYHQSATPTPGSFDWSSNIGVDAVFVKAGSTQHNLYKYSPESKGDTDLEPQPGQGNGISHISFCYDPDEASVPTTPPTEQPTTPPTEQPTTPPTEEPSTSPTPTVDPSPFVDPSPVVEPSPIVDPSPVVDPSPTVDPSPVVEPSPVVNPTPDPTDDAIPTTPPTPEPTDATQSETPSTQPSTDVTGDVASVQGTPGPTLPSTDGLPAATTTTTDNAAPIAIVIFGGSLLAMTGLVLRRKASSTNS